MKTVSLIAAVLCLMVICTACSAGDLVKVWETGWANINGTNIQCSYSGEWINGQTFVQVPTWTLPWKVNPGDVVLYDIEPSLYSDVLRFRDWETTSQMKFFSDLGEADPSDVGCPELAYLMDPHTFVPESSQSYTVWDPGNPVYWIYSDPVPEPSALIALGAGLLSLAGTRIRRRK